MKKTLLYLSIILTLSSCANTDGWEFLAPSFPDNFKADQNKDNLLSYKVNLEGKSVQEWNAEIEKIIMSCGFKPATNWGHLKEEGKDYRIGYFKTAVKNGTIEDDGGFGKFVEHSGRYYKDDLALEAPKLQEENESYYLHLRKFPRPTMEFDMEQTALDIRKTLLIGEYECESYQYLDSAINAKEGITGMTKMFEDSYKIIFYENGTFATSLTVFGEEAGSGGDWSLSEDTRSLSFFSYQGEKKIEGTQQIIKLSETEYWTKNKDNAGRSFIMKMKKKM